MRWSRPVLLLALLAVLCCTTGCARRARVIPERKLKRIYAEMYLADTWLKEHPQERMAGDTTLVFDPIFRRYGYTFEDYDRSVHYYLDHPEKFTKFLSSVSDQLRARGNELQKALDLRRMREQELDEFRRSYRPKDFADDSLSWVGYHILWPGRAVKDTLIIIN